MTGPPVSPPAPAAALACAWECVRKMFYCMWPSELALDDRDPEPKWLLTTGVPMFFVFIGAEFALARCALGAPRLYRLNDLLTCVSLGSLQYLIQPTLGLLLACTGMTLDVSAYR
jgi:hypothetical protein